MDKKNLATRQEWYNPSTWDMRKIFWLFLFPLLFAFTLVVLIPFLMGTFYSFTNWSSSARNNSGLEFIGLQNFQESFSDPRFLYSFLLTFVYTFINVFTINVVALALAFLVIQPLKAKDFYRMSFFLPNLIGGLVLGYVWQFIFNNAVPNIGAIFSSFSFLQDADNLILGSHTTAMLGFLIVGTWQYAGYIMMIYIAALQSIPNELYEAAKIDGAHKIQSLRHITIPMLAPAFTVTIFLVLMYSFKQFDVNVSLTAGGPATTFMSKAIYGTELLALNIYNTAFVQNNLAMGQARAVIFFIVLLIISVVQVRFNKKRELEA